MAFSALGLDSRILKAIQDVGYTEPTPIQAAAIPPILSGQDIVGIAQTGTGKTAAFTLPLLSRLASDHSPRRGVAALILAPTRELVVQIDENVRAYAQHLNLRIALVYGGVSERPQIQALRDGAEIVVATPGRLIDLMGRRHTDFAHLKFLVLDEADRMLDMGFLPSIQRIVQVLPRQRQTLLFSATLSREIESLIHKFQHNPKTIQIGRRSNPAETVTQLVYEVPRHLKMPLFVHLLSDTKLNMVLAFARTKHSADRLARQLERHGIPTATLHSNRSQNQRLRALKDFKSGAIRVLVATDIASRGIDVDGISHVVNFDFPIHCEDYVHRIGRTGRAQAVGDAISLVTPEDRAHVRSLEKFIGRGLVRKRADGFDYAAAATAEPPLRRGEQRQSEQRQGHGRHQTSRSPQRASNGPAPERPAPRPAFTPRPQEARSAEPRERFPRSDFQRPQRPDAGGPSRRFEDRRPAPRPLSSQPEPRRWEDRGPTRPDVGFGAPPSSGRPYRDSRGSGGSRPQPYDTRPAPRAADRRFDARPAGPSRREDAGSGTRGGFRDSGPRGPRPQGGQGGPGGGGPTGGWRPRPKFRS